MVNTVLPKDLPKRAVKKRFLKVTLAASVVIVAALVTGFTLWPRSPAMLAEGDHMTTAGVFQHWQAGDVVVLVRHAERCDQSKNPCLGPADGITQVGSVASTDVGKGFNALGMDHADVFSSPATRTMQTAQFMFGKEASHQEWLAQCGKAMRDDVVAHKTAHRNLVLVTHSGCISDFEKQTGFKHAPTSQYTSALFVSVTADGQLKVLGIVNSGDWPAVLDKRFASK